MDNQIGGNARYEESDGRLEPSLLLMPGKITEVVSKIMFFPSYTEKGDFKIMFFFNWRKLSFSTKVVRKNSFLDLNK